MEKLLNNKKFLISLFAVTAIILVIAMISIVASNNEKKNIANNNNKTKNNLIEFNIEKRSTEADFKDRDSNHEIVLKMSDHKPHKIGDHYTFCCPACKHPLPYQGKDESTHTVCPICNKEIIISIIIPE